MPKFNYLIVFVAELLFLIHKTCQVFNIDDFGAIPNDSSYSVALQNGKAFNLAVTAANKSVSDRTVLIGGGKLYGMLPAGDMTQLKNLTIQLDGKLNIWDEDHSKYPRDANGNVLNFISLSDSENLTIKGNGIIEGSSFKINKCFFVKSFYFNLI